MVLLLKLYQRELIFITLFAVLHSAIFHVSQWWWLAFVCLVPFFLFLEMARSRQEALALGYIAGILFSGSCYYWVSLVSVWGYLFLTLYLAVYTAIFSVLAFEAVHVLGKRTPEKHRFAWMRMFYIAALWILAEFLRSNIPVLKFPWALLGYSQWKNIVFIQSAEYIGPYGISFLIVIVNLSAYGMIMVLRRLVKQKITPLRAMKDWIFPSLMAALALMPNAIYGQSAIDRVSIESESKGSFRFSVIQGNIPQNQKFNAKIRDVIFRKYEGLSRQSALENPDLIIWPETSFSGYWEIEPERAGRLKEIIRDLRTRFLIGVPTVRFIAGQDQGQNQNSAFYFDPEGREIGRYSKMRLVPFGEYVPFFGFLRRFYEIGFYTPGDHLALMKFPAINDLERPFLFSTLICFEDIFPDLSRKLVSNGANVLINLTNDAWFESSTAPYQHAAASVLRAVENRVHVIRSANTGLSCVIDPTGKILKTVQDKGQELEVTGYFTTSIQVGNGGTFYTQYGDLIIWVSLLFSLLCYVSFSRESREQSVPFTEAPKNGKV